MHLALPTSSFSSVHRTVKPTPYILQVLLAMAAEDLLQVEDPPLAVQPLWLSLPDEIKLSAMSRVSQGELTVSDMFEVPCLCAHM